MCTNPNFNVETSTWFITVPGISDEGEDAIIKEHDGKNQQPVSERQTLHILNSLHTQNTAAVSQQIIKTNLKHKDLHYLHIYR